MKSQIVFLLSLILAGALVTSALADPKYVGQKKNVPTVKEVKREPASQRQQPPPPEQVKPRETDKSKKDTPPADRFKQWNTPQRKDTPQQKNVHPIPSTQQTREPLRGGGVIAPKPGTGSKPIVREERAPQPTGPMPTFLKGRPAESLKKQLPKQKIEGTIESIEDEKAIVRTRDGRRAVVQIGPQSYREQKNIRLATGQHVSVDGWGEWSGGDNRGEGYFFAGSIYGPGYQCDFADNDGYPYWADRDDYWDGWYPSWDAFYIYFWGPPPWWAYAPPPWYYRPPYWWHRHYNDPYYYPHHPRGPRHHHPRW